VTLASYPCQRSCSWHPAAPETQSGLPLFRCAGCASEWVRTEPWAPVDADGERSPALRAEVALRTVS